MLSAEQETEYTEPVKIFCTLPSTHCIEPNKKFLNFGGNKLLLPESANNPGQSYNIDSYSFMWLCALEVTLWSSCKAGSYLVDDPEDDRSDEQIRGSPQVLNIECSYIEEHFSTKKPTPSNEAIM